MGLGLVPTIGSLVTMTYATRIVGATTTAVLGVMEPITAICIGVSIFGEPLTVYIILGFVITAGAIIFMTCTDRKECGSLDNGDAQGEETVTVAHSYHDVP